MGCREDMPLTIKVEDDVDVWRYAILELHARNDDAVTKVSRANGLTEELSLWDCQVTSYVETWYEWYEGNGLQSY